MPVKHLDPLHWQTVFGNRGPNRCDRSRVGLKNDLQDDAYSYWWLATPDTTRVEVLSAPNTLTSNSDAASAILG